MDDGDDEKHDATRERPTVTEHSGSPFPDPRAPKAEGDVDVVPGQPTPSPDRPDDGGVRAVRSDRT